MIEGVGEDVVAATCRAAVGGRAVRDWRRRVDLVYADLPLRLADGVPGDTSVPADIFLSDVPYKQRHVGMVRPGRLFHLVFGPGWRERG